jgi:ribosomal protein S18 acetylase RimI-like enzyme
VAPAEAFDAAFRLRDRRLAIRPETAADDVFLAHLFARCSPLARLLPPAVLAQQAAMQQASHAAQYPDAMRRVVSLGAQPIGHIVIDWQLPRSCHGVDIAVLPERRTGGAGLHLLRAWLDTADRNGLACRLEVHGDNPAARLYARLGFAAIDGAAPFVTMHRAARRGAIAG